MTDAQIERLRAEYGQISKIDPLSPTYGKLIRLLDNASDDLILKLKEAQIPWVSILAMNRALKRKLI